MTKPGFRVLRHATYRAMPWRNGRRSTREIAREPATGEEFAWRLSLADIESDGDFSSYPGYSRALVLVAGTRLHLQFRGRGRSLLSPAKRGTRFEGDWKTHCAAPDGRCTDLSLIVRKGSTARPASIVRAPRVLRLESSRRVELSGELYGALYALDGSVAITESIRARARILRAEDIALFPPGPRQNLTLRNLGRSAAQLILLRWRPGRPRDLGC